MFLLTWSFFFTTPGATAPAPLLPSPEIEKVMANFRVYKIVEIAVFALGVALTFAFRDRDFVYAAGIGCVMQGAFMLVLDLFAEHRGAAYLEAVRGLAG